jgi:hypothetical protein
MIILIFRRKVGPIKKRGIYGLTFVTGWAALHTICEKTIKHLPVKNNCF